jgi:dATP pyrophosphohydrolase
VSEEFKKPISVLVVIHTPEREVLLLERAAHPGYWQSVTGSQEDGEDLAQTAQREVAEETGIVCGTEDLLEWRLANRFEIFQEWRYRYAPGVTHNTEHVYSLCVPGACPVSLSPSEHLAWRWLPWKQAARQVFSWTNRDAILMLGLEARD